MRLFGFLGWAFFVWNIAAAPLEEYRGLWVDTFHPGIKTREEIRDLLAGAHEAGINCLFVEIRKRGDAYYTSELEPKASDIQAGFDPLATLLEEARNTSPPIQIHAWLVMYPVWNSRNGVPGPEKHVFNQHPGWLTSSFAGDQWDGANYNLDPGLPEVQNHLSHLIADILERYEVDGIHLDYIRYPGKEWGYHPNVVERFQKITGHTGRPNPTLPDWLQFRRDQVTALVRRIYLEMQETRSDAVLSAATITFAPGISLTGQWPTSAAYSDVLQDWRAWMEEGILDLNIPMAYFRATTHQDDFRQWNIFIKDHQYRRQAAIGLGLFLNALEDSLTQVLESRKSTRFGNAAFGQVGFSWANPGLNGTNDLSSFLNLLRTGEILRAPGEPPVYANDATVPGMTWKTSPGFGHLLGQLAQIDADSVFESYQIEIKGPRVATLRPDANGYFGAVDLLPGYYHARCKDGSLSTAWKNFRIEPGRFTRIRLQWLPLPSLVADGNFTMTRYQDELVLEWTSSQPCTSRVRLFGEHQQVLDKTYSSLGIGNTTWVHLSELPAESSLDLEIEMLTENGSVLRFHDRLQTDGSLSDDFSSPPRWWLAHFGLSEDPVMEVDTDQDGYSDAAEYVMGTHPRLEESHFELHIQRGGSEEDLDITWSPVLEGRQYMLEQSASIPANWRVNPENGSNTQDQLYYRIRVLK